MNTKQRIKFTPLLFIAIFIFFIGVAIFFLSNFPTTPTAAPISQVVHTLPVVNNWKSTELNNDGVKVTFSYPPDWLLSLNGNAQATIISPSTSVFLAAGGRETPPDITIGIFGNSTSLPLSDFFISYDHGWYSVYHEISTTTINGRQAILANDILASIPRVPELAAFLSIGYSNVVIATAHTSSWQQFNTIIQSIRSL